MNEYNRPNVSSFIFIFAYRYIIFIYVSQLSILIKLIKQLAVYSMA